MRDFTDKPLIPNLPKQADKRTRKTENTGMEKLPLFRTLERGGATQPPFAAAKERAGAAPKPLKTNRPMGPRKGHR